MARIVLGSREANICFCSCPAPSTTYNVSGQGTEVDSRVQDAGCSCSYAGSWRPLPSLLTASELMGKGQSINAGTIVGRRR